MESSRPHVILSAAISVDGKIATISGDSQLSSKKDRKRVHQLRSTVDAILVGINTIQRDDPLLTVRFAAGRNPIRIVMDSMASISTHSKILKTCNDIRTIIAVSKRAPTQKLESLKKFPVEIVTAGEESVNPSLLLDFLYKKGIKSVMVEGGGTINWAFVSDKLFDEIYLTVSPFILGGSNAISLVQGSGFRTIHESVKLHLNSIKQMEDYLVLHYST